MRKMTVYLTEAEKAGVERIAAERGVTSAELIREFIKAGLAATAPRWDLLPVIHSPELAETCDEEASHGNAFGCGS